MHSGKFGGLKALNMENCSHSTGSAQMGCMPCSRGADAERSVGSGAFLSITSCKEEQCQQNVDIIKSRAPAQQPPKERSRDDTNNGCHAEHQKTCATLPGRRQEGSPRACASLAAFAINVGEQGQRRQVALDLWPPRCGTLNHRAQHV